MNKQPNRMAFMIAENVVDEKYTEEMILINIRAEFADKPRPSDIVRNCLYKLGIPLPKYRA